MSVLAYSELLKRIVGINEKALEKPFIILNRNNTTQNRLKVIKELAKTERATIGRLLKNLHQSRGGGSYITIQRYFLALEKDGLLRKYRENNKELWYFSKDYALLKKFIIAD